MKKELRTTRLAVEKHGSYKKPKMLDIVILDEVVAYLSLLNQSIKMGQVDGEESGVFTLI